jgi:hypothetical protein
LSEESAKSIVTTVNKVADFLNSNPDYEQAKKMIKYAEWKISLLYDHRGNYEKPQNEEELVALLENQVGRGFLFKKEGSSVVIISNKHPVDDQVFGPLLKECGLNYEIIGDMPHLDRCVSSKFRYLVFHSLSKNGMEEPMKRFGVDMVKAIEGYLVWLASVGLGGVKTFSLNPQVQLGERVSLKTLAKKLKC